MPNTAPGGWLSFTNVKEMVAIGVVAISGIVWACSLQGGITNNSVAISDMRAHNIPARVQTLEDNLPTALAAANARFVSDEQATNTRFDATSAAIQQLQTAEQVAVTALQAQQHEEVTAINGMSTQLSAMQAQLQFLISQTTPDGKRQR
jgi:hypothetical protein